MNGSGASRSACTSRTLVGAARRSPSAAAAPCAGGGHRRRSRRPECIIAAARAVVLPPGDAHASSTRDPGRGSARSATSCDASSCTTNQPAPAGREAGDRLRRSSASGAKRPRAGGRPSRARRSTTSSGVARSGLARSVSGAGVLLNRIQASVASKPMRSNHRAASHRGCDSVIAEVIERGVSATGRRWRTESRGTEVAREAADRSGGATAFAARR